MNVLINVSLSSAFKQNLFRADCMYIYQSIKIYESVLTNICSLDPLVSKKQFHKIWFCFMNKHSSQNFSAQNKFQNFEE